MKQNYIALAMLLAASSLNSMWAKTEAEFNSAKEAAIAKITSWSSASPFAYEAFAQGLADLENAGFSSYSDGDAAVKAVDDIVSATLAAAREELAVTMPTIFVTMTTDALTANPVDGGNLVGTPYEDRHYNDSFKTYSRPCQGSAWLIYRQRDTPGKYGLRNNIVQYIASRPGNEGERDKISAIYRHELEPDISVDFADNGKMIMTVGDNYIGTDATGSLAYFDTFSDATSWTFTRAYDKKCDLPRISTEENPIWYVFRNASAPDEGCLTSQYPNKYGVIISPLSEASMWRFEVATLGGDDWFFTINKNGAFLLATDAGHSISGLSSQGGPYTQFGVIDGYEEYGLIVCLTNQSRMLNFNNIEDYSTGFGCPWLLTKGTFNNGYSVDLSWSRTEWPAGSSYWFLEEAGDASLLDFLGKRSEYAAEVRAYAASQPWARPDIEAAAQKIEAVEYSHYSSVDDANAAIRTLANEFLAILPTKMMDEASGEEVYFSINNSRSMDAANASGWMIATDDEGNFTALATQTADASATWYIEKVTDTTFRLKNRTGLYIGNIRSGQVAKPTEDPASAATFSFILSDGRIILKSTRSCLSMNEADGTLTAAAETDPGVKWVLKNVVVMAENDLVTSDISNQWLYTITSVSDPLVYFESEGHRFYCYARGYLTELSYWYLEDITNGDGGYRFVGSINASTGTRMCRNPLNDNGDFGGPVCYDNTIPTSDWAVENWYVVPVEYDGKHAYQITTCYPPKGNCCISRQMINGVMTYSTVDDLENTAWYFNHVEGIDHEGMFNNKRDEKLADLDAFIRVQPFVQDFLTSARDYVAGASMTDFGPDYYSSYSAMVNYVYATVEKAKWLLEEEPRGCTVRFCNVRRAKNGSPTYLAAVDGHANTIDLTDEASEKASAWTLEYDVNGCYRLKNDNGEYLGQLSADIETVADADQAGLYFLDFRNYYMTVADRDNPEIGINVDQAGNNACQYDSNDSGSRWTIELVRVSGIDTITVEDAGEAEYFDLNGLRVSPADLVPGIYIRRCGHSVSKILVK